MNPNRFDDLTDVYEAMSDWPKRLANEEPFFRRLFEQFQVKKLADVACGTGRHAAMFHGWGLEVQGVDISANMLERARGQFGEPAGLKWVLQGFDRPIEPAGSFDAALCLGNSLALAGSVEAAGRTMENLLAAVRPGGLVVIQVVNVWKLPEGPCIWQKTIRKNVQGADVLIVKGVHRFAGCGYVDLLVISSEDDKLLKADSFPFLGLTPRELESAATRAGADKVDFYGNHQSRPYEPQSSPDLILVARKSMSSGG